MVSFELYFSMTQINSKKYLIRSDSSLGEMS